MYWRAFSDLLLRYKEIFRVAWADRNAYVPRLRVRHEAEFLPAHLELMETPVHPAPRLLMRVLVFFTLLIALIAFFGKLDIVVVAKGELIPDSNVKIVQPAISGVVRAIHVADGQKVQAGQVLVELDTRQATADATTARANRIHAELATARARALLRAVSEDAFPKVDLVKDASPLDQQQAEDLAGQTWQAFFDKRADAVAELSARQADLESTRQEIAKLTVTAPLARQQADAFKALLEKKDVAQIDFLDREQTAQGLSHDLAAQRSHAMQLEATVTQQKADLAGITSGFLRDQRVELDKNAQDFKTYQGDEAKAIARASLLRLTAPTAGTVQQLAIHSLGGVVTSAQTILEVVPSETLQVKASFENQDVGFVRVGQPVVVKVAAFPYTHYGHLRGTVIEVANDAEQDRRRGPVFVAYVRLTSDRMYIDGKWVSLTPGMSVSAEIITGKRSVISYFLGPLIQHAQESMHER